MEASKFMEMYKHVLIKEEAEELKDKFSTVYYPGNIEGRTPQDFEAIMEELEDKKAYFEAQKNKNNA